MRTSALVIVGVVGLIASPARVLAYGAGVFGYSGKPPAQSCTMCHAGGPTPTITLSGPTSLMAGESGTYAMDIVTGASTRAAGFDVAASDGALGTVVQTNESWINSGELSHTKSWPKGAMVRVQFTLTAPSAGPVTLFATGLSSDAVDDVGGDGVASTTFTVDVVSAASVDLGGADLASTGEDLAVLDAVSSATMMPPPTMQPDLGPPRDEPRWACACDLGHHRSPAPFSELFIAMAALAIAWSMRRRACRRPLR